MAQQRASVHTSFSSEEVITSAVQFFSGEKWKPTTQMGKTATFEGRPPIPIIRILMVFVGFFFFVFPGIILYFLLIKKMYRFHTLVVSANPITNGTDVVVTYPDHANKLVNRFMQSLPSIQ